MASSSDGRNRSRSAVFKVLYLLGVTAAAFAVPAFEATRSLRWYVISGLLGVQFVLLGVGGVRPAEIFRAVWRLKWLFVFLVLCYGLLPPEQRDWGEDAVHWWNIPGTSWMAPVNLGGLARAGLMCLQIVTVILASAVVRLSGSGRDLVDGLRTLGLPKLFVYSLDQTLEEFGSLRRPGRNERGNAAASGQDAATPLPGLMATVGRLLRGDLGEFLRRIQGGLDRAGAQTQRSGIADKRLAHDVAVIAGIAMVMVSLKVVKLLPGVPFAPGVKTLLLFPLYALAAHLTWTRWGATAAGSTMGVIAFLNGDGRYGVLEVLKHVAPGLVIDLSLPIARRLPQSAWVYCVLGFLAAIARTSTDLVLVLLLGARAEVYLFPAATMVPNLIAGTLSGFVTAFVLRNFPVGQSGLLVAAAKSAPLDSVPATGDGESIGPSDRCGVESLSIPGGTTEDGKGTPTEGKTGADHVVRRTGA
jgi:hypothetical protein